MTNRRAKAKSQNNLNKQLTQSATHEKEKNESLIQLGKFFYTLAVTTYAGAVLTFVVDYDEDKLLVLFVGSVAFLWMVWMAWLLIKRGNIKK